MSCCNCLFKFAIFILIISILLPLLYGSTNYRYIFFRLFHSSLSIKHRLIKDDSRPNLSSDYRAFEEILRMKPLLRRNPDEDPMEILLKMRDASKMNTLVPKPHLCNITKEVFQHQGHSVDTFWVDNHQNKFQRHADHIIIYFHGGAYLLGDINSYSGVECHFSKLFNITILHVEYRLSPEHALPAAVEDTVAIYHALLQHNISPSQLMFMGDSAGGGLSLLTIQAILSHKLPVPRGAVVFSPWTDLSASGESHIRNRHTDILLHNDDNDWLMEQVLGPKFSELSHDSPTYSPLFGSFTGFPPMYINVGTAEILEDDSRRVYTKAFDAGVDVTFEEGQHLMHVYPIFFPYYPEARQTLKNINEWIQRIYSKK